MEKANISKYEEALNLYQTNLNDEKIEHEVAKLLEDHRIENDRKEIKYFLLSTIELTTLKVTDSQESVLKFTEVVNKYWGERTDLPHLAAICVYPNFAKIVSQSLEIEGTEVACVVGGFPSSQTFIEIKTTETALAIKDGANQCDMVMSVGTFFEGDYETVCDEIEEIKATCDHIPLKVIIESGALETAENIKKASILSMYSGADFIKTSTGKISVAATHKAAYVMCQAIKEYYEKTGRKVGFKAAGGINTVADAINYYTIVKEILGEEWFKEGLFRIGTSRLLNLLLSEVTETETKLF